LGVGDREVGGGERRGRSALDDGGKGLGRAEPFDKEPRDPVARLGQPDQAALAKRVSIWSRSRSPGETARTSWATSASLNPNMVMSRSPSSGTAPG
jgi:hypothetical protein